MDRYAAWGVEKVGILVNPSWEEANAVAALPGITASAIARIRNAGVLRPLNRDGIQFEKALPVQGPDSVRNLPDFFTRTVLLDSGGSGEFGGMGRTFPWEIARDFVEDNPDLRVILAGGLTPENVAEAVALVRPFGVDVTTGVESSTGRKDHGRMRAFLAAARAV